MDPVCRIVLLDHGPDSELWHSAFKSAPGEIQNGCRVPCVNQLTNTWSAAVYAQLIECKSHDTHL